ncbi:G-type lectin S-receptor-like serine/threonine-protein kinase CES101 isoform X2 [Syzygium oleosum]|uniref:G-type lectin S-receptor-like serine/threonine-protein kinase CES101 isoform X2 n=1 Tax=Syzygium oleosum TaxID=219896 RepID=UPI0011D27F70|nr:G-type lectin S-receptor-like serine/threonine-protein kinase CES101 isoform X2 [Syzygium oleosum]
MADKKSNRGELLLPLFALFFGSSVGAIDTIGPKDLLTSNDTLVSRAGVFELGFFNDVASGIYYLGIWFRADPSRRAVWVNRENPMIDSSCTLQIRYDGNLVLIDRRQTPMIVNSGTVTTNANTSATLTDSGNLVLKQGGAVIWQSFDYPTDTYLPGMKIGLFSLNTDQSRIQVLVSWVSPQNPSRGSFTLGVDYSGSTELSVWREDNVHMDIGFWDRERFRFIFANTSDGYNFSYVSNENETYFTFSSKGTYASTWFVMASTGQLEEYNMIDANGNISFSLVTHQLCRGSQGGNSSNCLTSIPFMCEEGNDFLQVNGTIPNSALVSTMHMGFNECEVLCQGNCSCKAFVFRQDNQTVCQHYYGNKKDLLRSRDGGSGTFYVRGDTSAEKGGKWKKSRLIVAGALTSLSVLTLVLLSYLQWIRHKKKGDKVRNGEETRRSSETTLLRIGVEAPAKDLARAKKAEISQQRDRELALFTFSSIEVATDYFAPRNKLGEGGFGPVYKGQLPEGLEIAVKRLSKMSRQGLEEFKNKVTLISKLQHRNLVRLLGCCIEGEESILIYEYMPNKSLDSFIFDPAKRVLLDWRKRVGIIEGIAQGILYLHKYSRLRIIHRDLKTSNILLDSNMNPKISDFGMARIFGENETRAKTIRVVGTCGYMSPEYAMDGLFSEMSDVFAFGIILLEIVSGEKNIAFFECDHSLNLPGKAWNLWKEGKCTEFVDGTLATSCPENSVERLVQLGLLCVQERPTYRPTMSDVVSMLNNETIPLHLPREPAFLTRKTDSASSSGRHRHFSASEITVSELCAR